jgi:hypothetical protein
VGYVNEIYAYVSSGIDQPTPHQLSY